MDIERVVSRLGFLSGLLLLTSPINQGSKRLHFVIVKDHKNSRSLKVGCWGTKIIRNMGYVKGQSSPFRCF